MLQKTTLLLLLIVLVSCKKTELVEKDKIKTADWLIGNWEGKTDQGVLTENWEIINDSTFSATSYFIKGKDTLHFETITLEQKAETLIYNALVKGQNNDKTIAFPSTILNEQLMVFENPTHDYPQKISYIMVSNDSIVAEVSGMQQGKPSSEKYGMKKIK